MIVTLSAEFSTLSVEDWAPYIPAVQHLIQAHMQGWHFFVPDRQSALTLKQHPSLSARFREIFEVIIEERLTTLQGYAATVAKRIQCELVPPPFDVSDRVMSVAIDVFNDLDNCLKSKLIVENAEADGIFYVAMAQEFAASGSLLPSLSLDVLGGGGHTTAHCVSEAVRHIRPSITIVDGDRTHPSAGEGGTAAAVRTAFTGRQTDTHELVVTRVRALENFIPFAIADHFLADGATKRLAANLAAWQKVESDDGLSLEQCVTAFYGPRKGLKMKAIRLGSRDFKARVGALCAHLGIPLTVPGPTDGSLDNHHAIPPLSSNYAGNFLAAMKGLSATIVAREFLESPFSDHLDEIAGLVVSFGAAPLKTPFSATA